MRPSLRPTRAAPAAAAALAVALAAGPAPTTGASTLRGDGYLLELAPALPGIGAEGFTIVATLTRAHPAAPDLAPPFGVVDSADTAAFVGKMEKGDPVADIAEPLGVIDAGDLAEFLRLHEGARR